MAAECSRGFRAEGQLIAGKTRLRNEDEWLLHFGAEFVIGRREEDFEWCGGSKHLAHVAYFLPNPLMSSAHNEERADAWLDHVRDNDQKLAREILT
ncbi:hypothetical protein Tco_0320752 [Tanacetum coccineum]